ncbi:MobF family relaxase [Actinomycetospora cinnamomea]|uniref:Conjugative relaxase-like TrwC/TraI family protein n=1 Tax=Actinomycetospora cinnamomea TaxID=663609 RepID=A0A2U1F7W5_9PSEU|nr:MobF family relaxase [Actinomycetospora cinnamomea]PVZ08239.1 conjugative relaxase-like TrwC/TraI family protein [Actinomycetospora cinnamomea]
MLSVASGYSPDYLLKEVAAGRENYYTGAVTDGEPPGRWWGRGAEKLGLTGLVDPQDMRAVYEHFLDPHHEAFRDPDRWDEGPTLGHRGRRYATEDELYAAALEREPDASAERRAELRVEAGKQARHNVAFLDATFSVQKSVTVLHTAFEAQEVAAQAAGDDEAAAAWGEYRQALEDAIWAGNNAALSYLSERAGYARVGHHGGAAGRYVDAHDWVVTSFFQHDSRDHDPQLHIHNPILNRVEGPDGQWRTLDGRSIYRFRPAAAAVGERTTEERLSQTLGVRLAMRPDGKAREVIGVDEAATELLSSRRRAVTARAAELIAEFEARHGREANGLERDRLSRQATMATRRAKSHEGETREQLLDRIDRQLRDEVAGGLRGVAEDVLAARHDGPPAAQSWSPTAVLETALAEVQAKKAGWTRADLTRAINDALPDTLGIADGEDVATLLDRLTDQGIALATPLDAARPGADELPDELRLADGSSAYQAPGARLYATPDHVHTERAVVAAGRRGDAAAAPRSIADRFLARLQGEGIDLGADQEAAVRGVLTSGAKVETLIGPAGTGKSFVVGMIARGWSDPDLRGAGAGRVFGLATSQAATDILTDEGLTSRNVARWLKTQDRLDHADRPHPADAPWALHAGDLVVVDESAMTDTAALTAIHARAEAAGAKLLLVGDHRQLAAVGAGGAIDLVAQTGTRYELAEARRFRHDWEGPASLRLRDGDETVVRDYHRHGRLLDAGTLDAAEASASRAWLADTLAGRRSLLVVDTNDQADRLNAALRAELVRLGRVTEHGAFLGRDGTYAGIGDLVAARRNGWELTGHAGNQRGPINRETYRVTAIGDDGSLTVVLTDTSPTTAQQEIVLPAEYVAADLSLAYAGTVHSAQGATVDTSHLVATPATSRAAAYVGLTRGRDANTAHVTTITGPTDPARGLAADHSLHRDPVAVLAAVMGKDDGLDAQSALAIATESAADAATTRTAGELFADAAALAATERTGRWLDRLAADGVITGDDRAQLAAEDGAASLTRVLRRAEIAGKGAEQVLREAVTDRPLDGARNLTNVIHARIRDAHTFDPQGTTWREWSPATGRADWNRYLETLADAADQRSAELAEQLAEAPPPWLTESLGPVPDQAQEREEWLDAAGTVGNWRELQGYDDPDDALGPAPAPGKVEAYASYRAAWQALGRPDIDREELELSDGQLRVRVRAHEREAAWAPRYVANELAGTNQAAERARQDAELRRAEAQAAADEAEQARLREAADATEALAGTLTARASELAELDDARSRWLAHTAGTRAAAGRAKAELAARHADDVTPEPEVTAEEWLAAHRQAVADEEAHRNVTDADVTDRPEDINAKERDRAERHQPEASDVLDDEPAADEQQGAHAPPGPDIREVADAEPAQVAEDNIRVPTADETSAAIERANRALAEMRSREEMDAREEEQHRADQLAEWQVRDETDDHSDETGTDEGADHDDVDAFDQAEV